MLEITIHEVSLKKSDNSILIAHVSDLHSDHLGELEKKVISAIGDKKPDIIVITGDLATPGGNPEGHKKLLKHFQAPLGVYFVMGNWDYWEPIQGFDQILQEAKITNLTNKSIELKPNLWLFGFDDELTGSPISTELDSLKTDATVMTIFHSPTYFKQIAPKIDLALAGHSHGGQIRLPFLGPLWLPSGTDDYDIGWYQQDRAKMYVSRGIGNSILPIRINCRPEVAFIKVNY